jgi:hypothetical protein
VCRKGRCGSPEDVEKRGHYLILALFGKNAFWEAGEVRGSRAAPSL